jgi:hypothetical protein
MFTSAAYRALVGQLKEGVAQGELSTALTMTVAQEGYDLDAIFKAYET